MVFCTEEVRYCKGEKESLKQEGKYCQAKLFYEEEKAFP